MVEPVNEVERHADEVKADWRNFQRRHAVQVRKRLFLAAMNEGLRQQLANAQIRPSFDTVGDQLYASDLNRDKLLRNFQSRQKNAPDSIELLEQEPQLVNYFAHNLPILWHLGAFKKDLKREWALNCFQNPCEQHERVFDESSGPSHSQMTRKHPYFVWHLSKRFKSLSRMDVDLEAQESAFISLYCSDYIRESIEVTASKREKLKSTKHGS